MLSTLALSLLAAPSVPAVGTEPYRLDTHPWARWTAGAWVRTESSAPGSSARPLVERYELVEVGAKGYELDSALEVEGGDDPTTRLSRTFAFGGFAHHVAGARIVAREEVEVAGRSYPCEVWEARSEVQGQTMIDRSWMARGIDLPLRTFMAGAGAEVELTATSLTEVLDVGRDRMRCVRYEGDARAEGRALVLTQWMSLEMPGGVVRLDSRAEAQGQARTFRRQVTAFRGDRRPPHELTR